MKKRIFSLILVFAMLVSIIPCTHAATIVDSGDFGKYGDNVKWTFDSSGTLTLSGNGETRDFYSIPWNSHCPEIKKIVVEEGITHLAISTFNCCANAQEIIVPDSLTDLDCGDIHDTAFYKDESNWENGALYLGKTLIQVKDDVSSISVRPGTMYIGSFAFFECDLSRITLPDSLRVINGSAFCSCDKLTSINIPNGVTDIGYRAFALCENLSSITIPDSVTHIGSEAFLYTALENNYDPNNPNDLYIGNHLIYGRGDSPYTVKQGTISIADSAFYSKETINIPSSVVNLNSWVFNECRGLQHINVDTNNKVYSSVNGVLFNKNQTELISYPRGKSGSYSVPSGTKTIGEHAFDNCKNLTSISIPNSVTAIGEQAFQYCENLTSITIPHSVTFIGYYAFSVSLTDIYYDGTEEEFQTIAKAYIGTDANIHYLRVPPTPTPTLAPTPTPAPTPIPPSFTISGDTVKNTASTSRTATVIVAEYNGGKLTSSTAQTITFADGESRTFTHTGSEYRIFVWDSLGGMQPLNIN